MLYVRVAIKAYATNGKAANGPRACLQPIRTKLHNGDSRIAPAGSQHHSEIL